MPSLPDCARALVTLMAWSDLKTYTEEKKCACQVANCSYETLRTESVIASTCRREVQRRILAGTNGEAADGVKFLCVAF